MNTKQRLARLESVQPVTVNTVEVERDLRMVMEWGGKCRYILDGVQVDAEEVRKAYGGKIPPADKITINWELEDDEH